MNRSLFCCLCAWTLSGFAQVEEQQTLELEGALSCSFIKQNGTLFRDQLLPFTMRLDGPNRWSMRNLEGSQTSWERGCNGTNVFNLFLDKRLGRPPGLVAFINQGVVPSGSYPGRLPWLAFASSTFLHTNSDFPAPWADANEPGAHIHNVRIRYSERFPALPQAIEWVVSSSWSNKVSTNTWLAGCNKRELKAWLPDETNGFLSANYRVLAFTNIGNLTVPACFELTRFRFGATPPGITNCPISVIYSGRVRSVRLTPKRATSVPELPPGEPVSVYDLRLFDHAAGLGGVRYVISNQVWITDINDPRINNLLGTQRRDRQIGQLLRIPGVGFLLIFVLPIALAVAIIWVFVSFRRRSEEP